MAEWFKATDLRPVIYDAWVRTPLSAKKRSFDCKETKIKRHHPKPFFFDFKYFLMSKTYQWHSIIFYHKKITIKISVGIFSVRIHKRMEIHGFLPKSILGFRFWTFFLSIFQKGKYFCAKTRAENQM